MSEFELLSTDGYGLKAEFTLNGTEYGAMDDFSECDTAPRRLTRFNILHLHIERNSPEFDILCLTDQSWDGMFSGNPQRRKELVRTGDWSYDGYGQIISVAPVVTDFGYFTFEIGDFTNDQRCVGEFIYIIIDRLDLTFRSG